MKSTKKSGAPRATGSAVISFGMVSIPVKLYTSTKDESVRFNMINPATHNRCKQKIVDAVTEEEVNRNETLKGFEYQKDNIVTFTKEELEKLSASQDKMVEITEFVNSDDIDPVYFSKSYYLGADKGGDKPYALLTEVMRRTGRVAIGRWYTRGQGRLVLLAPYGEGLILHQLWYANEVRGCEHIAPEATVSEQEIALAEKLVATLASDEFDATKYRDEYGDRVRESAELKAAGGEIATPQVENKTNVTDLFAALNASLDKVETKETKATKKKAAKKTARKRSTKKKASS